jgi:hypothetical protein
MEIIKDRLLLKSPPEVDPASGNAFMDLSLWKSPRLNRMIV